MDGPPKTVVEEDDPQTKVDLVVQMVHDGNDWSRHASVEELAEITGAWDGVGCCGDFRMVFVDPDEFDPNECVGLAEARLEQLRSGANPTPEELEEWRYREAERRENAILLRVFEVKDSKGCSVYICTTGYGETEEWHGIWKTDSEILECYE